MSSKNEKLQQELRDEFMIDGEQFYDRVQFLVVFKLIGLWIDKMVVETLEQRLVKALNLARHAWLH